MFIVLEGLDGAGTTTQAGRLAAALAARGQRVHLTAEPSAGAIGRLVRMVLRRELPMDEPALALLFAADRLDHLRSEIEPRLAAGEIVVCDRYYLSNLAYQSLAADLDLDWLRQINARARRPDLTLFLDVPPEVCLERLSGRGDAAERYESLDLQRRIDQNYRRAIGLLRDDGEQIVAVDGRGDVETVHRAILDLVAIRRTKGTSVRPSS